MKYSSTIFAFLFLSAAIGAQTPVSVTITGTDSSVPAQTVTTTFSLMLNPAPVPPLVITTSSLRPMTLTVPYLQVITFSGGTSPDSCTATGLPAGLTISATSTAGTCTISGIPTGLPTVNPPPTPTPTPTPAPPPGTATGFGMTPSALAGIPEGSNPWLGGYRFFGDNYPLNQRIDNLPVSSMWASLQAAIGTGTHLQLDSAYTNNVTSQAVQPLIVTGYPADSDRVPMPQSGMAAENGGDQHLFVTNKLTGTLDEAFSYQSSTNVGSEAVWNVFSSIDIHPATVGSADAAGLPVIAYTAKWQDIVHRTLNYPIRFTMPVTAKAFIPPASHWASVQTDLTKYLPMGARLRLRADFDVTPYNADMQYLLGQLKTYGIVLADNGSAGFVQADTDPGWYVSDASGKYPNDLMHALFLATNFELVNNGAIYTTNNTLTGPGAIISGTNPYTIGNATFAYIEGVGPVSISDNGTAMNVAVPSRAILHAYNQYMNSETTVIAP